MELPSVRKCAWFACIFRGLFVVATPPPPLYRTPLSLISGSMVRNFPGVSVFGGGFVLFDMRVPNSLQLKSVLLSLRCCTHGV